MFYTIGIGRYSKNWEIGILEFDGNVEEVQNLKLKTIEQAKQIIKIVEITSYQIYENNEEHWHSGKVIEETQDITDYNKKVKKEREDYQKAQYAKVERINKLPLQKTIISNNKIKVILKRSEATYIPSHSSEIKCHINIVYRLKDWAEDSKFYLFDYVARGGKLLRANFKKNFLDRYGLTVEDVRLEDIVNADKIFNKEIEIA